MGSVVGEKLTRLIERATEGSWPVIIISTSGGARMQEGAFSLMQMAKTSAALAYHAQHRQPYISVLTNNSYGGVMASYAALGDLILAEPGAMIGFAGPRVIKDTTHADLPPGFQTAEFLLDHGLIDAIAPRKEMKERLIEYLRFPHRRQKKRHGKCLKFKFRRPASGFTSFSRDHFVTDAVDGEQVFRFAAVVAEFFAELHDDLVQRARRAVIIVAPDFIQQLVARQHLAGVRVENLQQFQFLGREFFRRLAPFHLKCFRVNRRRTDFERLFVRCLLDDGTAAALRRSSAWMRASNSRTPNGLVT